jgi:bifunctional aspartokinase / homoserine dehydrogenase 1
MKIVKFGGSSIASSECIRQVLSIVEPELRKGRGILVFSACRGVTESLLSAGRSAAVQDEGYQGYLRSLEDLHTGLVRDLLPPQLQSSAMTYVKICFNELEDLCHGVFLVRECTPRVLDYIASFGERLSAYIINEAIRAQGFESVYVDTRSVIRTDTTFGNAQVDFSSTRSLINDFCKQHEGIKVVTGFIGSTAQGETTTLGRNGSDYTASIFAWALSAESLEIWTDTPGIMTADPALVYRAYTIPQLSYHEAMELSHFGAQVVFPASMLPVMKLGIPVYIRNTFAPEVPGTLISAGSGTASNNKSLIKGISSLSNVTLLTIQGPGLIEVVGMSRRFFSALAEKGVNVVLISQASSEHSICIAVNSRDTAQAVQGLEDEFAQEISSGKMDPVITKDDMAIVAVVGENMKHQPGSSGKMFQSLGRNNINVFAIAQGSSELNISAVVSREDLQKALNALHESFFITEYKVLHMFLLGTGLIGSALLKMISEQLEALRRDHMLDIQIHGVANSRTMVFHEDGFDPGTNPFEMSAAEPFHLNRFLSTMMKMNFSNSVFVDCTASEEVASSYASILEANISVVTPNKKANSESFERFQKLQTIAKKRGVSFLYETNVAAGLPVISTLQDLVLSGDRILKIEGVLSGSLNFIFSQLEEGRSFSEAVRTAKEKGYTEPDPRDDLSGLDVARKILILGRVGGEKVSMEDIEVRSLVPEEAEDADSTDALLNILEQHDTEYEDLLKEARNENKKLRFMASLSEGTGVVGVQSVHAGHPFYNLKGSDNMILFTTERYREFPMVIRGPGAGAEVTAAGVFADIIRVGNYIR